MTDVPRTRWARTIHGACIACQDFSEEPVTLVIIHGRVSHLEVYWEEPEPSVTAIERFIASAQREEQDVDRMLATVLFTDVVGSTDRACELGDHRWTELLERHNQTVRALIARYRGTEVRAGCHAGEVELLGAEVGGIAVHIGARVAALAGPSEVLVSSTVKHLVAGAGLTFVDRGEHRLKGVSEPWRLHAAEA